MGVAKDAPITVAVTKNCQTYLDPLVKSGRVKLVCDQHVTTFAAADHQKMMEQCLTKTNNGVDAVLSHNDDVVGGDIAALKAEGLEGKVKVYGGYDASVEGLQRVLAGWQRFDIVPPYQQQAYMGVQMLLSQIANTAPPAGYPNMSYWNGHDSPKGTPGVLAVILKNVHVFTADDIRKNVIDNKIYTKAQLCDPSGVAAKTAFCAAT
jgi:D-xylose transport system substrate-binding protein